jgi:oligopeptide/dipeptide ABC transporter ATP-binding protein
MYAGRIVETADVRAIFAETAHPYTLGLLNSNPSSMSGDRLTPIDGQPPDLASIPQGCPFHPRCLLAKDRCLTEEPKLQQGPSLYHSVACHFFEEVVKDRERGISQ